MGKRVITVVLDSVGIGALPDAALFGDEGSHTLKSCFETGRLDLCNLCRLGLGRIEGCSFLPKAEKPLASWGRMAEQSAGKDTTVGHWELAGLVSPRPLPTYPDGFPKALLDEFSRRIGRGVLCNRPYSGTQVIADFGEEHLQSGSVIVYTSADSVFQVACHEEKVSLSELDQICLIARELLQGEHAVGRVIARPFLGEKGHFYRTPNRHDYSLPPQGRTLVDAVYEAGLEMISVGKIVDIFAARTFTSSYRTASNVEGMRRTSELLKEDFTGMIFTNLVEFDSQFGHRNDAVGYAEALNEFDRLLPELLEALREDDLLIITADHGCDPATPSTDHSREYVPLLVYGKQQEPTALGTRESFCDLAASVAAFLGLSERFSGKSFLNGEEKQ